MMVYRPVRHRGFTLVELVVVTLLVALLAGLAGSMGMKRYRARGLEVTARRLYQMARYARYLAVNRHQPCKLLLDETAGEASLALLTTDPDTGQLVQRIVRDRACRPVPLPAGVSFASIQILSFELENLYDNADGSAASGTPEPVEIRAITFKPDGTADGALVTLTNRKKSYTLTVEPGSARARIQEGTLEELEQTVIDLDRTT